MSPARPGPGEWPARFPRVSGDEPGPEDLDKRILTFSPRERG